MNKKEQILELREQGKSYKQIQEIVGCSRGTISYHCGVEQKLKSTERQKDRRKKIRDMISTYKTENNVCADCKESYAYWQLDFDHLENKSFGISSFSAKTADVEKIKEEMAKCEIVCANCHRNRTFYRQIGSGNSLAVENIEYWEAE